MREQPRVPEERLQACLRDRYDLIPMRLEFLPRGKDYSAGLFRVLTEQGTDYLLKVTSRPLYEPAFLIPHYLKEQGIASVVAPIPNKRHALWTKLEDWTAIVYPYIEGDTAFSGMTNDHWKQVGNIFRQIHQTRPPEDCASLRKETFDPTAYARWVRTFETQHLAARPGENTSERAVRASWLAHQATIHTIVTSLEKLAQELQAGVHRHVICHADLHGANLIRDQAGHVFVIDWDEVMLAPPERDFIFIREPHAGAFWEGYGQIEIDWTALTYYRWERVAQDLIECAQNVCLRDDLGEATKAEIAQMFDEMLDGGSNLAAAYSAAAHLAA
jgi:spectinomycin phosphotransferase